MASASSSPRLFTTTPITSAVDSLVLFFTQSTLYSHSTSTLTFSDFNSTSINQFKANFTPDNVMVNFNTANDDPSNNDTSPPSTSPSASASHAHLTNQLNHFSHLNHLNLTELTTFHDAVESVQSEYYNASSTLVNSTSEFSPSNTSDTFRMVILSIVLGFLILATALGNICVILAIRSDRNLRSPQNLLIYSLAIADLLVSIVVMPFAAVYEISGSWFMGGFLCNLWTSADVLCCTSSILHLVAIALDRYWAVTNIDYSHSRTPYKIRISIFCVWIASIIVSIVPHFGLKDPEFDKRIAQQECLLSQDVSYQLVAMALSFYIPLAFILFLYSKIFQVARKRIRNKPGNHAVVKPATNKPVPVNITHSPISNINKDTSKEPVGISSHHSTNISSLTSQLPMKVPCSVVEITPESLKQVNERSENMEMLQAIALAEKFDQETSTIGENQLTKEYHRQPCNLWPSIDVTLEGEEGETRGEKRREKNQADGNEGAAAEETGSRSNKKHDSNKTTSVVQVESVALSEEHNREKGSNSRSSHQLSPANAQVEHLLEVSSDSPDVTNASNEAGSATVTFTSGNTRGNSERGDAVEHKKEGTIRKSSSKFVRGYRMHNERPVDERCEQLHHENTSIVSPSNLHSLIHQAQQTRNELTKNQPFVCSSAQDSAETLWRNNSIQGPILEEKSSSDLSSALFARRHLAKSLGEKEMPPGFTAIEGRQIPLHMHPSTHVCQCASVVAPLSTCPPSPAAATAACICSSSAVSASHTLVDVDDAKHNNSLPLCNVANRGSTSLSSQSALRRMAKVIGEASDESGCERERGQTLSLSTAARESGQGKKNNRDSTRKEQNVDPSLLVKGSGKDKVTKGPTASLKDQLKEQSSDTVKTAQVNHSAKSNRKVKGPLTTMSTMSTTTTTATTKSELTTVAISTSVSISSASAQPALAALKSAKEARKEKERKTAKTLAIITGVFIVCWLPFFVMTFLMSIYAGQFLVPKIVFSVFQWLGWANSLLNPVIYTIFSPDFRNAFKKMLIYNRTGPNSRSSYYLRSARTKVNTGTGQSSNKLHPVPAITADPVSHFPGKKGDRTGKQQQQQQEQSVVPAKRSKEQTGHSAQEARRDLRQMPIEEKSLQSVSLVVSKQEQSPCPSPKQVSSSRESQSSNSPPAVETTHSNDFTSSNRTQTPSSSMSAYL